MARWPAPESDSSTTNTFSIPSTDLLQSESRLDLVVAGTRDAILMVESEANNLSEDQMLGAVMFGHQQMQTAIDAISDLAEQAGKPKWDWQPESSNTDIAQRIDSAAHGKLEEAYQIADKSMRQDQLAAIRAEVCEQLMAGNDEDDDISSAIKDELKNLEAKVVRGRILEGHPRIDGRDTKTVRPIDIRTRVFPRTHGSAAFTRGETQALVITTLGTERDAQIIDALEGEHRDPFLLHYNFPPFSVGETGRVGSPKRREIGHGRLAKRAIAAVLPKRGRLSICHSSCFRNHGIQWLKFHGYSLWHQSLTHGCWSENFCTCIWSRHGAD